MGVEQRAAGRKQSRAERAAGHQEALPELAGERAGKPDRNLGRGRNAANPVVSAMHEVADERVLAPLAQVAGTATVEKHEHGLAPEPRPAALAERGDRERDAVQPDLAGVRDGRGGVTGVAEEVKTVRAEFAELAAEVDDVVDELGALTA